MGKFNMQNCPVCNEKRVSDFLICTDFFVSGENFEIKECTGCGLKITFDVENEENIGRYYQSENYISHSNTAKGLINTVYHQVRKYMLGRKRKLVEKVMQTKTGSVLDVGTGTGYFLNEMKNHGWQVTGTEKSREAREFAKKEFDLDLNDSEDIFHFENLKFDAITLWHVLEHIHRLNENMEMFVQLMKPAGKLIVAVPNNQSWDANHYKQYWAAWDVPRHLWHFDPTQMKILGKRHGLRLSRIDSMPFDSFYVSILSEKYKNSKSPLIKGVFHGKISWLASLLNKKRGSSVIYIFEKQ